MKTYKVWMKVRAKKGYSLDHQGPIKEFGDCMWLCSSAEVSLQEAERMVAKRVFPLPDGKEARFMQGAVDALILPADLPKDQWPKPRFSG